MEITGCRAPVQCVDDVNGIPRGVIVFDDKTFTIPFSQNAASGNGQRPWSSVKPFQFPNDVNEGTVMEWEPAESNEPFASSARPFQFPNDVNEDTVMEWDPAESDNKPIVSFSSEGEAEEEEKNKT